jgi:hypothetical protein
VSASSPPKFCRHGQFLELQIPAYSVVTGLNTINFHGLFRAMQFRLEIGMSSNDDDDHGIFADTDDVDWLSLRCLFSVLHDVESSDKNKRQKFVYEADHEPTLKKSVLDFVGVLGITIDAWDQTARF